MSATLQEYVGQVRITSTCRQFQINDGGGAEAVVLDLGKYFASGYTSESDDQLIEHMQTQIRAVSGFGAGEAAECNISRSTSTGLITIAFDASVDISWDHADLQTLLGFTGSQTSASSYVATNTPKGVWRPTEGLSEFPVDLTEWWAPNSTSKVTRAPDGTISTVQGAMLYDGIFGYRLLDEGEVKSDSSTVWESFQSFFENVIHAGYRIRAFPDRTAITSDDYREGIIVPPNASDDEPVTMGRFADWARRHIRNYNGLWGVDFRMLKAV